MDSGHAMVQGGPNTRSAGPRGQPGEQKDTATQPLDKDRIFSLVQDLVNPNEREQALLILSKNRDSIPDLAPILWYSFGTMTALLQEIISIYPVLSPPKLTVMESNRACNSLALLQSVASHPTTRALFMHGHMPLFLYPFLNTTSKEKTFEYLRVTSLGVIGALVKTDETEAISFLLQTEIIPLCLRIMETGNELSKTVATFIVQKILLDDMGLQYICQTYERFSHVALILGKMVHGLAKQQSSRLLKHVVRCYLRLSDNSRAREALRQCLPEPLKHVTFVNGLKDDQTTKRWLAQLLHNLSELPPPGMAQGGSSGANGPSQPGGQAGPMLHGPGMNQSLGSTGNGGPQ
eukprot:m.169113 g.169113  ORF g.169113 m.169113 type:complete len:349 (+) comp18229_c0_seq1:154-1200(+)